jgi:hypothetical protein
MKRLYTSISSPLHVAGLLPLHCSAAAGIMPRANASFAQQSLFSFSLTSIFL